MNYAIMFDQQNLSFVYRHIEDAIEFAQNSMIGGRYNPMVIIAFAQDIEKAKQGVEHFKNIYSKRLVTYNKGNEKNETL